jgi:hypothetical protein
MTLPIKRGFIPLKRKLRNEMPRFAWERVGRFRRRRFHETLLGLKLAKLLHHYRNPRP